MFLYSFRPTQVLFASSVLGQCEMSTKPLPPTYTWLILFPRGAEGKGENKKEEIQGWYSLQKQTPQSAIRAPCSQEGFQPAVHV